MEDKKPSRFRKYLLAAAAITAPTMAATIRITPGIISDAPYAPPATQPAAEVSDDEMLHPLPATRPTSRPATQPLHNREQRYHSPLKESYALTEKSGSRSR